MTGEVPPSDAPPEVSAGAAPIKPKRGGGPKSARGRSRSKRNALTHGAYATVATLCIEDPEVFPGFQARMLAELAPVGVLEEVLAARVILAAWRLRRFAIAEAGVFEYEVNEIYEAGFQLMVLGGPRPQQHSQAERLAMAVARDGRATDALGRIHAMEGLIERALYRGLHELRALQRLREKDACFQGLG